MKFSVPRLDQLSLLFLCLLVITTIVGAATNEAHYALASVIRLAVIAFTLLLIGYSVLGIVMRGRVNKQLFFMSLTLLFVITYAGVQSILHGGVVFFLENPMLIVFLFISICLSIVTAALFQRYMRDPPSGEGNFPYLGAYFVFSAACVFLSGGLQAGFPPHIEFVGPEGHVSLYSQGFTKLYVMAWVYFFITASQQRSGGNIRFLTAIFFFALAALGGARGELLAGVLALVAYFFRRPSLKIILIMAGLGVIVFYYIYANGLWEKILVIQRFMVVLEGNFGQRDRLIDQGFRLLGERPDCLLTGCGFNYFQIYWGYPYGLYPHNVVVETFITVGLFIGCAIILMAAWGAVSGYLSWGRKNPVFYIFIVNFIIALKSNDLLGLLTIPVLSSFAFVGLLSMASVVRRRSMSHIPDKV